MTPTEIKTQTEILYKTIADAEERLKELRAMCGHENTEQCIYSWRAGSFAYAIVCSDCGEFIQYVKDYTSPIQELSLQGSLNEIVEDVANQNETVKEAMKSMIIKPEYLGFENKLHDNDKQ